MSAMTEFLKDFAIGYAVSYAAATLVEEKRKRTAEGQGMQTFDDQFKNEMYKLGRAIKKMDDGQ